MFTRGIKVRLIAFLILSAVGIVYVAGSYLGIVDRVLGRGVHIHATLPDSGGVFEGSEVTFRGVKVGKVTKMHVIPSGVRLDMTLEHGTRLPKDSPVFVHNLSAVGEQYVDFEPASNRGPYARNGDTIAGNAASLPISEEALLTDLDGLVNSVDGADLATVVGELGTMFRGTAKSLQRMVDSGSQFVDAANASTADTIKLFDTGKVVLQTQARHEQDIQGIAKNLADLTGTLKTSDPQIRTLLQGGPGAVQQVDALLKGLEPTLPVFLSNLITTNQVFTANLPGLEQMLVTFPRVISSGFTGTPGDGYGHINLQLAQKPDACTDGFKPSGQWRPGSDLTDAPVYPATCRSTDRNFRGTKHAPATGSAGSSGRSYRVSPYDAQTGAVDAGNGSTVTMGQGGRQTVFGDNSWQWMLMGPTETGANR